MGFTLSRMVGNRQRGGESGRFDAKQIDQARDAMPGVIVNSEICGRCALRRQFGPDADIVGLQSSRVHTRPIMADLALKGVQPSWVHGVVNS